MRVLIFQTYEGYGVIRLNEGAGFSTQVRHLMLVLDLAILALAGLAPSNDGTHLLLRVWKINLAGQKMKGVINTQGAKVLMGHLLGQGPQVFR